MGLWHCPHCHETAPGKEVPVPGTCRVCLVGHGWVPQALQGGARSAPEGRWVPCLCRQDMEAVLARVRVLA